MKKIELFYFTVTKILSSARNFEQFHFFLSTARIRFYLIRAVEIFLSSSRDFEKKCRAVEIRADAFRAVHPDSPLFITFSKFLSILHNIALKFFVCLIAMTSDPTKHVFAN
jgi:hypothetical protein